MIHCFLKKQSTFLLKLTFFLVLAFSGITAQAQSVDCSVSANCSDPYCQFAANIEKGCNCFDGIDNDGDGAVDQADSNCATYYGLVFVGEDADCSIVPPGANTPFDLVGTPVTSAQNTADTQSKVSVGDVDGDGIPDAVITSKWNSEIRVVATASGQADGTAAGQVKSSFKTTGQGAKIFSGVGGCNPKNLLYEHENLIADIDKDGKAELFGVVSNRSGNPDSPPTCFFLVGFRYAPSTLIPLYNAVNLGPNRPGTFGIADMDGDGKAEIYLRDRIYAAETGALLATANGNWDLDVTAGPVAVNINGDDKMELVCGTKIYSIPSLANRNPATPAALTLVSDMNAITANKAYVKLSIDPVEYGTDTHSMCSVADIDKDGSMDVVISGALNMVNGPTAVFYWNVAKGTVSYYLPADPTYINGWPWGTGRVNLGDANGDGRMDLSFIAGARLHCLTTDAADNLVPLWPSPRIINDTRSGVLTVSIYDFNNDGDPEMAYRDSQELVVIDGATGTQKLWSAVCQSHTYTEGPVIADVNGDGSTDICVSCNTSNSFDINDGIQQQALGQFRLYYSSGNEWLPTRKVWNQPGYFVVNIKDDLTLPFPQLDQSMVFGTGDCLNGLPGPQTPMNVFLNQVPYLSASGCPVYPAPDLSFVGDNPDNPGVDENGDGVYTPTVEVIPPICGDLEISVRFNIINDGDLPITANIPVSFFIGDPTDPSITSDSLIYSTSLPVSNLDVDSTYTSPFITFNGTGSAFRLYIVLNNDGSVLPIDLGGSVSNECRIDNNIYSVFIQPDPFTTKIEKIQDNFKCENTAPDNGELRVRIFKEGVEVTDYSQYGFQWYTGTAASYSPIAGATNYNLVGLAEGDYTAIVTNTAKGCTGAPVDTTIVRLGNDPEVVINVTSHQTVCNPPNGELEAVITGGNVGFTFEWFDIALNPLGISGPTANNLVAGNYLVRVSKDGCSKNSLPQTVDGPVVPDAQASTLQNIVDCSDPNTGSVTARALFNSVEQDPAGYSFEWYFYDNATSTRGSILPVANGTGETRTGLPVGHYQVVVTDLLTQCAAIQAPVTEITSQTVIPTAVITELAPQTSCDPATPNGRLSAAVELLGAPQDPANFTFEWFVGDNTLPENAHDSVSGTNGSIAEAVAGGGVFYTVRVTTGNNCTDTEKLIVTENLNVPVVTLTPTDNGICDPSLATSTYNGSVSAAVSFDSVAVADFTNYQITWHNGSLDTDPVIAGETSPVLDERNGGFYTVVIERTDLSCTSVPVTAQVNNATVLPVIATDSLPSTNCEPALANGKAWVTDVDGLGAGLPYGFQWYTGNDTTSPMVGATDSIITNLQGGIGQNFTVLVTNQNTGCQNTFTVSVPDARVIPLVSLNPNPNTICNPTLTNPSVQYNGSVLSTITNQASFAITDYEFTWTDEENGSQILQATGAAGKDLLYRDSSNYTVIVKQSSTGCVSDPVTAQVLANTVLPVITADATASTNCDPALANGGVQVTDVDSLGLPANFIFEWHEGSTVAGTLIGNLAASPDTLQGGVGNFFTVLVTNQDDGCQNTETVEVADARVLPLVTLAPQSNTICDATLTNPLVSYNGRVDATISNMGAFLITDYHFDWTDEETSSVVFSADGGGATLGESLINLDSSYYTVVIEQISTGCISSPVTAQVTTVANLPVITADANASTNCDPALANGGVQVTDVDALGLPANFVFEWHEGSTVAGTLIANLAASPDTLQGGAGNFFTVLVTNQDDGCQNTETVEVPDARVLPLVTLAPQSNTICDATLTNPLISYNGRVDATISNMGAFLITDYHFDWTDEETSSLVFSADGGGATLGESLINRDSSYYTVVIEQLSTGCVSSPVTAQVTTVANLPVITADANASTNCDPALANGGVQVTDVDALGLPANFIFEWHEGSTVAGTLIANLAASPDTLQGGAGNFFTVLVTNQDDGCQNTETVEVPDARVLPLVTLAPQSNTICDATLTNPLISYNGRVDATISNMGAFLITDYHFDWTDEETSSVVFSADGGGATLGESLINRDSSYYTVVIEQISTGCVSSPVTAQVTTVADLPVITADANASTNCDPALANGGVQVTDVDALGLPANFIFEWHEGSTVAGTLIANLAASPDTLQGGAGNFFTVLVTNQDDGCQNTETVEVPDARVLPLLSLLAIPNTVCDSVLADPDVAYTGSVAATINNIGAFLITDYHFTWTDEEDGSKVFEADGGGATPGETLLNRDSSYYTLVAEQISTGCVSSPVTAEITPDFDLPVITADANASTNCEPLLANGGVQVLDVDGAGTPPAYKYDWFSGNTVGGTLIANAAASPDTLQGGAGNFFTTLVTNLSSGCQNTTTVEVPDERILPLVSLLATPNTVCDSVLAEPDVAYTGSVAATINNQLGLITDYHFIWTDEEDGSKVFEADGGGASLGETLANRDTSYYTLVAEQISTGCVSAPVTAEVKPDFFIPMINIANTPQTSCDPANPNGALIATIDETSQAGIFNETAGYDFVWHAGSLSGATVTTTGAGPWEIISLAGDASYAVEVTRQTTGCRNTSSAYLPENIVIPAATLAATPQTYCNPADGEIIATITPAPSSTYTFYWLKEAPYTTTTDPASVIADVDASSTSPNRKATGSTGAATDTYDSLFYGDYTLVVVDNYTKCVSATYTGTVVDERQSDIDFNAANKPASCASAEGKLDLNASRKDGAPTNFTFDVYLGGPTNSVTPINFYTNPPVFDPALNNNTVQAPNVVSFPQNYGPVASGTIVPVDSLRSDLYSVVVTDDFGCQNLKTIFLPFLDAHEIDWTLTDSQICPYTIGDGSISVKAVPPAGDTTNQSQYTFRFYKGGTADPGTLISMPAVGTDPYITGEEICADGLDNDGDGIPDEGCPYSNPYSWPVSIENCTNGIDDDGDGLADAADPDCSGRLSARNLAPGFYTVEIQEDISGNGCKVYEVIEIGRDALPPVISLVNMTANTACDLAGADGQFTMNIDQAPGDSVVTKYDFDVISVPFSGSYTNRNPGDTTFIALEPATYTINVTAKTGCVATKNFTVQDNPAIAQVADKVITDAEFCDPALETSARIEITRLSVSGKTEICGNGIDDDGDTFVDTADPDCNDNLGDYTFEWYTDAAMTNVILASTAGDATATDGGEVLSNVGSPAPATPVTIGSYYVVATKVNAGPTGGFGCSSAPTKVDIGDKTVTPAVTLHPFGDTSCDGNFEGRIEIEASTASLGLLSPPYSNPGAGALFLYEWDDAGNPVALGTTSGNNGNRSNAEPDRDVEGNLEPGTYVVSIINEATGCRVNATSIIQKISPPVFTLDLSSLPQDICKPDGNIQVNDALVNGASDGTGNFVYEYFAGDPNTTALAVPNTTTLIDVTNYATIKAGTFYVVATRKANTDPGSGCSSAPQRIDIMDTSKNPVVKLTPSSNTSCDNFIFEGSILVDVTDPGSAPTLTYTYDWDDIANPSPIEGGAGPVTANDDLSGIDDNPIDLKDGTYRVTITNDASGCFVNAQTTILKTEIPVIIAQATPLPQVMCDPDGSITVNNVTVGGVSVVNTDFDFTWYRNDLSTEIIAATPGEDVLDVSNYATIGAGAYFVKAKRTTSEPGYHCESAPLRVDIEDNTEDPTVVLTPYSNTSCDNIIFEGSILVDVTDPGSAPTPTYTYDWDDMANPSPIEGGAGPVSANDDLSGMDDNPIDLKDGTYRVTITNDASGCFVNAQTTILKTEIPVIIAQATPMPQVICNPDGSITVNNITVGGAIEPQHTDFDFTWYRNDLSNQIIAPTNNLDVLNTVTYPTIGAGTYFVKVKRIANEPGFACESAPLRVDIEDNTEDPAVVLTPYSNTSCDNIIFEGSILVDVTDPGSAPTATYTYDWDDIANPSPIEGGAGPVSANDDLSGIDDNPIDLKDGTYRLTITNDASGCFVNAQTTVLKTEIPIIIAQATPLPQVICNPDGSITVDNVSVGGVNEPDHTDFDFTWYRNDLTNEIIAPTNNADILNVATYASIGAGTYFVKAKRITSEPGFGCESAPLRVDIKDSRVNPLVSFTTISNTSCDNNFDAQITVTSSVTSGPGTGANYDLIWTTVPSPAVVADTIDVPSPYVTPGSDNVGPGAYRIRSVNRATQCLANASVTIISNPQPVEILTVNKQDQMICFPDGSITVSAVSPSVVTDYTFNWYRNNIASTALEDGASTTITSSTLDNSNYATIGADTYFVVGRKNATVGPGSGCLTPPFRVNIEDLHSDPTLAFTFAPNSSCDPSNPNGQLIATAQERDGTTDDYTFNWTLNSAALPGVTIQTDATPNSQLDDAFEGSYMLVVTNTLTGCTFTSGRVVNLDQNVSLPNIINVDTFDPTNCLGSGSAEVTAISVGGGPSITGPALGTDFQYEWYEDDFVPASQLPTTTPLLGNLNPGRFYVRVMNLDTDCKSSPTEVVIQDENTIYPVVTIEQTALQISCIHPFGTAALLARGDGNTDANPNYRFRWFNNLDTTPPPIDSTSLISDMLHGEYSVLVTNTATGCSADKIFIIRDDSDRHLPQLSLSTEGRVNCVINDGKLLAREVGYDATDTSYPYSVNFTTEIYPGDNADVSQPGTVMNLVPTFNRNWLANNLDVGSYTVKITDNNTGCFVTGVDVVDDIRINPVVVIVEDNPLINCDPAIPNGQLSATADGGRVGGYQFEWYGGSTASGAILTNNNKLVGRTMGEYTVRVTNAFTSCFADALGTITDGMLLPPSPTAMVIFDRARCDYPDGWVAANVDGVTFNYSFDWYDGSALKSTPDFNGVNYQNRDLGFYTVTAMDEITGCISPPASVEVKDLRVIPEVIVTTMPSYCDELPGSTGGNGSAEIQLSPADVVSDEVTWNLQPNTNTIGIGSYITGILPGFYQANVITSNGCEAVGVGEVKTEVFSYNLVSSNGDGKNDDFRIDCISQFPNNNVKIFNRSGVLVYEADGYDNNNVVFKGLGEKGVYTIGNKLPAGTYFYIIDKKDGSKSKTGFLELVK